MKHFITSAAKMEVAAELLGIPVAELRNCLKAAGGPTVKDRLLKRGEAAHLLGVSRRTVDMFLAKGRLPKVVLTEPHLRADGRACGGRIGIPLSAVEAMIAGKNNTIFNCDETDQTEG